MLERMKKWSRRIIRGIAWCLAILMMVFICLWAHDRIHYGIVEVGVRPKVPLTLDQRALLSEEELRTLLQVEYLSQHTYSAFRRPKLEPHIAQIDGVKKYSLQEYMDSKTIEGDISPKLIREGRLTKTPEDMVKYHAGSYAITLEQARQYAQALSALKIDRERRILYSEWNGEMSVELGPLDTHGSYISRQVNIYMFYTPKTPRSICQVSPNLICYHYWWQEYFPQWSENIDE